MSKIHYLKEPEFIPTKWLVMAFVGFLSIIGGLIHLVLLYGDVTARLDAQEHQSMVTIDELKYRRVLEERTQEFMKSIDRRLSYIEGEFKARHH